MATTITRRASRKTKTSSKKLVLPAEPRALVLHKKLTTTYQGAKIPATKVYRRRMTEFTSCKAEVWMMIDDNVQTVTYANTYSDQLKASYNPSHYCYPLKEKVIAKKLDNMIEVEVTDWPEWIENVAGKKSRKATK